MDRPLTPIERMIDAACGFSGPVPAPRPRILLRCPVCKVLRLCERADIDPPAATVQEYPCPKCGGYGTKDDAPANEVRYFDKDGQEIPFP